MCRGLCQRRTSAAVGSAVRSFHSFAMTRGWYFVRVWFVCGREALLRVRGRGGTRPSRNGSLAGPVGVCVWLAGVRCLSAGRGTRRCGSRVGSPSRAPPNEFGGGTHGEEFDRHGSRVRSPSRSDKLKLCVLCALCGKNPWCSSCASRIVFRVVGGAFGVSSATGCAYL